MEPRREGTPRVVPLDSGEKLNEYPLGNVFGHVVVVRYPVSRPEDRLVVQFKENPQGLLISSLTLANCLMFLGPIISDVGGLAMHRFDKKTPQRAGNQLKALPPEIVNLANMTERN